MGVGNSQDSNDDNVLGSIVAQSVTVGLLWHSVNSNNLGVGALTVSNISIIEQAADELGLTVKFIVLGWRDPEPPYVTGKDVSAPRLRARQLIQPGGFYKHVRDCDFVVDISAGDSFADIYGFRRITFNLLGKMSVLLAGKPLVFGPQTIGPFNKRWARAAANFMMRKAKLVATRDDLSTRYVEDQKILGGAIEATDVAMRLPYDTKRYAKGDKIRFGLNVSGLMFNGGYSGKNMFHLTIDYANFIRDLIAEIQKMDNCELHLIAHVISPTMAIEDDFRVCEMLSKEFPDTILAPRFIDPSDAKSYISTMDFFTGARMHACIAAFSSGVPVVPMSYSRKFEGLFGTLNYPWITDCRRQTGDEILTTIMTGFENREDLAKAVAECFAEAGSKLQVYQDHLKDFLADAALKPK